MSNRTIDNHPYNVEKFRKRKGKNKHSENRRITYREMVRRAQQRIIAATRRKGNGFISACQPKDAVAVLKKWVHSMDGKIGKGQQIYNVLMKAFKNLTSAGVFEYIELPQVHKRGYELKAVA